MCNVPVICCTALQNDMRSSSDLILYMLSVQYRNGPFNAEFAAFLNLGPVKANAFLSLMVGTH